MPSPAEQRRWVSAGGVLPGTFGAGVPLAAALARCRATRRRRHYLLQRRVRPRTRTHPVADALQVDAAELAEQLP
jgi:hypothetical protein